MINAIAKIISNVTGFIDNLNLSKKDVLIIMFFLIMVGTAWSSVHYKNKANHLKTALETSQTELRIERDNTKIENNNTKSNIIGNEINITEAELRDLATELKKLYGSSYSREKIMEELKNVKNTQEACKALADMGYPICSNK